MSEHTELLPEVLPGDPLGIAARWLEDAWKQRLQPNPNAMVLSTERDGRPSARVVLCKAITPDPGYVVFYTNYLSRKGRELAGNPRAAGVIHWDHLHRQIRFEGHAATAPASDSDAYFASRALQSRIGAWASAQSEPIASRAQLVESVAATSKRLGVTDPENPASSASVPRPPHWGGYRIWVDAVELWVEGAARIHDRARWTRNLKVLGEGRFETGPWTATRLQP
jgi:pyridoxamine 5'-phosphate oxidase